MAELQEKVSHVIYEDEKDDNGVQIEEYQSESQLASVMRLITNDLSEPYSIYTYRYFINNWPRFCLIARDTQLKANGTDSGSEALQSMVNGHESSKHCKDEANGVFIDSSIIGAVVCKLDQHKGINRGYVAMLAVHSAYRRKKIATRLVCAAIERMEQDGCEEVVLETEVTNLAALRFYEKLGFLRDKRLYRYYLNGVDALRLKLWLTPPDNVDSPVHQVPDAVQEPTQSEESAQTAPDTNGEATSECS